LSEGETGKVYIRISVPKLDGENGSVEKELLIQAVGDNAAGNSASVTLHIHPPVTSTSWWNPTTTTAAIIGLMAAVLATINSIEWGRYKFLGIFLPLYTKLKKEDVMNQYTRGKIHGYLLANPGDYFSSIGKALNISGGNLAYHLRVLEREGKLVSRMDGIYKRFYPRGARIEYSAENELSSVQKSIYDAIEETPGIIQREIASLLGVTSATVSYHLGKLVSRGMVMARRKGMAMRYFIPTKKVEGVH
jgi:predicted transcriptional regulator